MIKAIVFDFRDTLIDIAEARKADAAFLFEFSKRKIPALTVQQFQQNFQASLAEVKEKFANNSAIHNWNLLIISNFLNKVRVQVAGRELQELMEKYDEIFVEKVKLYPDAVTILKFLKDQNIKTAVVIDGTAKRERAILSKLGLEKQFNAIIISEEVGRNKLTLIPLQKAIEKLGVEAGEIIVVGDRIDKDIAPANKLGCISVKLERTQGRYSETKHETREEKPTHVISSLVELANFL